MHCDLGVLGIFWERKWGSKKTGKKNFETLFNYFRGGGGAEFSLTIFSKRNFGGDGFLLLRIFFHFFTKRGNRGVGLKAHPLCSFKLR